MYGRIFETLYKGSMVGAGSATFAVWCYVIANMRADDTVGAQVDLNPALIGFILGEKEEVVEWVIERLCAPDPKSTNKAEEGRRLIKLGQYSYRVVSGADYMSIRNEEDRREYFRVKKQEQRAREAALTSVEKPFTPRFRKRKPSAPKELIYKAMDGYKGTLPDPAPKLRELHGVEDNEFEPDGTVDPELAADTKAKIARAKEREEEVKMKLGPGYGK